MVERRPITIVLAVLTFLNGVSHIRSDQWWGWAFVLLSVLLAAHYFSRSVREFTERHRIPGLLLLVVVFGVLGAYYTAGNVTFALVFWLGTVVVGILTMIEIWAVRTYPDLDW
jgi:hypothetical protein